MRTKHSFNDGSGTKTRYTWYAFGGNAIYEKEDNESEVALEEISINGGGSRVGVYKPISTNSYHIQYELADHLGNVRAVISQDNTTNAPSVEFWADYYVFGGLKAGRNYSAGSYRYEAKGQENAEGQANWSNFELRMLNKDLGRWMTPDPYGQFHSPYLAMGNNPVSNVDPDGGLAWYFGNSRYYRQYYEWTRQEPSSDIVRRYMGVQREFFIKAQKLADMLAEQRAAFRRDHPTQADKDYMAFEMQQYWRIRNNLNGSYQLEAGDVQSGWSREYRRELQEKHEQKYREILGDAYFDNIIAEMQGAMDEIKDWQASNNSAMNNMMINQMHQSNIYSINNVAIRNAIVSAPQGSIITVSTNPNGSMSITTVSILHFTFTPNPQVVTNTVSYGGFTSSSGPAYACNGCREEGVKEPRVKLAEVPTNKKTSKAEAGTIMMGALTLGAATSELPPIAAGVVIAGAVAAGAVYFKDDIMMAGFINLAMMYEGYLYFAQHGKNNGRLQDDEREAIRERIESGTASSQDKLKWKRDEKNRGLRSSRQSKDKK